MHYPGSSIIEKLLPLLGLEEQGEGVTIGTQLYVLGCLKEAVAFRRGMQPTCRDSVETELRESVPPPLVPPAL